MSRPSEAIFGAADGNISRFEGFVGEVVAHAPADVVPSLRRLETAIHDGMYAAGFLTYEAASALDADLPTLKPRDLPLLWFGLYKGIRTIPLHDLPATSCSSSYEATEWSQDFSRDEYRLAVSRIRNYIATGDIYQANFTFREHFRFRGDMLAFFLDLCRSQPTPYSAFFEFAGHGVLSASPELFFQLDNGVLTVRPMKGTTRRGRWPSEDEANAALMRESEKERAENLMIVDLLRNDLARVSEIGSVKVSSLFDVETLGAVHQMTSTISSRLRPGVCLAELFSALFPCGSITGAPKKRSMEIIAELERFPRGIYTGCIGYFAPRMRHAVFSVAIRTLVIDKESGAGELGVGSGITWDSSPDAEYDECLDKGLFAQDIPPDFRLIESLMLEEQSGYFLLDRHLERLRQSASYFGFIFEPDSVRSILENLLRDAKGSNKVRILLSPDGSIATEVVPLQSGGSKPHPFIAFAETHVDSADPFLYHKTSNRGLYRRELEKRPDCADVIFVNELGEVTEGANSNLVIRKDDRLLTPPCSSGLLPGTFRAALLEAGDIVEQVITQMDVVDAEEIYLINSVRKWRRVRLVDGAARC